MDQLRALELCRKLEGIAPDFGAHVALTGGCLYKTGERKDVDIILYRIRQIPFIDLDGLYRKCEQLNICKITTNHGWVTKATTPEGYNIDFFNIEFDDTNSSYGEEH